MFRGVNIHAQHSSTRNSFHCKHIGVTLEYFFNGVCVMDLAGCVRWTWGRAELCSLRNTGNSLPWGTNAHITGHHWLRVRMVFHSFCLAMVQKEETVYKESVNIYELGCKSQDNSDGVFNRAERLLYPVAGVLSKGHVRCPWHGACFNIATGDIEDFPGLDSLPTFQVILPSLSVSPRMLLIYHSYAVVISI